MYATALKYPMATAGRYVFNHQLPVPPQADTGLQNLREVAVVVKIARQLTIARKSFRIITPYDPQRSLLENGLKDAGLPWEDKCFNIDAFQGPSRFYFRFIRRLLTASCIQAMRMTISSSLLYVQKNWGF